MHAWVFAVPTACVRLRLRGRDGRRAEIHRPGPVTGGDGLAGRCPSVSARLLGQQRGDDAPAGDGRNRFHLREHPELIQPPQGPEMKQRGTIAAA